MRRWAELGLALLALMLICQAVSSDPRRGHGPDWGGDPTVSMRWWLDLVQ